MNDFDTAARSTAKLNPPGFFRWVVPDLDAALAFRRWLDTRTLPFPGEPDRTCDTVGEFGDSAHPDHHWALVTEFEAEPESRMLARLLEYLSRLYRENHGKLHVGVALINLTGAPQPDTLDMSLPGMEGYGLRLRVVLKTMRDEDAAATLAGIADGRIAYCILPWVPLMHGSGDLAIMNEWKRLAGTEQDRLLRSQYAGLALVFAELAGCVIQWKQELEGWNMRESQVVAEWRADGVRSSLLQFLRARFKQPIPDDLVAAINTQHDREALTRWVDEAATTSSLDEFRAAIQH